MDAKDTTTVVLHGAVSVLKWTAIGLGALIAVLILGFLIVPPLTRHWTDRWGTEKGEYEARLPGDDIVADPQQVNTKAITIEAPAPLVHKLIVQMGYQRAGWYGWDWFYNGTGSGDFVDGHYSTRIVPELQDLEPGDVVRINEMVGYEVIENRAPEGSEPGFVIERLAKDGSGNDFDPADGLPEKYSLQSWVWYEKPLDADTTRLYLRIRAGGASQGAFVDWLYDKPLDFGGAVMGYKTMVGIKRTAEKLHAEGAR